MVWKKHRTSTSLLPLPYSNTTTLNQTQQLLLQPLSQNSLTRGPSKAEGTARRPSQHKPEGRSTSPPQHSRPHSLLPAREGPAGGRKQKEAPHTLPGTSECCLGPCPAEASPRAVGVLTHPGVHSIWTGSTRDAQCGGVRTSLQSP